MTEELKPCPFCGNSAARIVDHDNEIRCNADYDHYALEETDWQNAYCWQELDKRDAEIKQLKEELLKLKTIDCERHLELDQKNLELTEEITRLKKLLNLAADENNG